MTRHGTPVGDPGPFTCLFFTPLTTGWFLEKPLAWWESRKLAYSPVTLAVVFRVGLFSFLSAKLGPVWPKPAPDRAGTGPFPTWGVNSPHRPSRNKPWLVLPQGVSWGQTGALGGFVGRLTVGGPPVPEGTQGTQNSARGGTGLVSLARAFQRVQGGNAYQCTLLLTHNM